MKQKATNKRDRQTPRDRQQNGGHQRGRGSRGSHTWWREQTRLWVVRIHGVPRGIIKWYTWNVYSIINQCHPNTLNKKNWPNWLDPALICSPYPISSSFSDFSLLTEPLGCAYAAVFMQFAILEGFNRKPLVSLIPTSENSIRSFQNYPDRPWSTSEMIFSGPFIWQKMREQTRRD